MYRVRAVRGELPDDVDCKSHTSKERRSLMQVSETIIRASDDVLACGVVIEPVPPLKAVMLFEDQIVHVSKNLRTGLIVFKTAANKDEFDAVEVLSESGCLEEAARNLLTAIRRLDALGLDLIAVQRMPAEGIGIAINDTLYKVCC